MPQTDFDLLHQAARLAKRGHGCAEPNPMVGCVITNKNGVIVGDGFHEQFGQAHAEINALKSAGLKSRGGTAYITLEPCNHQGKTPPCSQTLLEAGITRVVIGAKDPHQAAGGGAAFLRQKGIDVVILDDAQCEELVAPFVHRINTGLPWVTCKWAQTIDGCIETSEHESPWISSMESQHRVHQERGCVDAIVVGVGTVIADNPSLTVRHATKHRTPIRVVIDPTLRTPENATILNDDAITLLAHAEHADTSRLPSCLKFSLPSVNGVLELKPLFQHLVSEFDAANIIVEGGGTVFQHIFDQMLANELWIFTSPHSSSMKPKVNMNDLVQQFQTKCMGHEMCGVDSVERLRII